MVVLFSFCLLSTSILLFFSNYSKWFPGFTFNITLKKWFLGIISFILCLLPWHTSGGQRASCGSESLISPHVSWEFRSSSLDGGKHLYLMSLLTSSPMNYCSDFSV